MNIIFIEPINTLSSKEHRRKILKMNNNHNYNNFIDYEFEVDKINNLNKILKEAEAKVVLYTRNRCCSSKLSTLLYKMRLNGFNEKSWLDTVSSDQSITKSKSLELWLNKNNSKVDKYVIIDNRINNDTPDDIKNIFWVDEKGLDENVTDNIIKFFKQE